MKKLDELLREISTSEVRGDVNQNIVLLCYDSRQAGEGALFFAVRGTQVDGHKYIDEVILKGCTAVVCEAMPAQIRDGICYIRVDHTPAAMTLMASGFYDYPSAKLNLVADR